MNKDSILKVSAATTFAPAILAAVMAFSFSFSCASTSTSTALSGNSQDDIDLTIREVSDYLNGQIPKGNRVVILNMQSDYAALSDYIIDELIANAVNDKVFSVVDRAQLDQIRAELKFQLSEEVDDKQALEIGKIFGAQTIVSGAISELGDRQRIRIRAMEVQTAQVIGQYNRNIAAGPTLAALLKGGKTQPVSYGNNRNANAGTDGGAASAGGAAGEAQASAAAAPVKAAQAFGMKSGTYTLWPRPRAMQAGLPINFYIAQITASAEYIVFFFARSGEGDFSNGHSGFWDIDHFSLQDLDNPSRFYNPVQARNTSNGMGTIWSLSFKRFPAARFKVTAKGAWPYGAEQIVWEEISVGEPDE